MKSKLVWLWELQTKQDFKTRITTRNKNIHYIMVKG